MSELQQKPKFPNVKRTIKDSSSFLERAKNAINEYLPIVLDYSNNKSPYDADSNQISYREKPAKYQQQLNMLDDMMYKNPSDDDQI